MPEYFDLFGGALLDGSGMWFNRFAPKGAYVVDLAYPEDRRRG
jgi:hypothetical protein